MNTDCELRHMWLVLCCVCLAAFYVEQQSPTAIDRVKVPVASEQHAPGLVPHVMAGLYVGSHKRGVLLPARPLTLKPAIMPLYSASLLVEPQGSGLQPRRSCTARHGRTAQQDGTAQQARARCHRQSDSQALQRTTGPAAWPDTICIVDGRLWPLSACTPCMVAAAGGPQAAHSTIDYLMLTVPAWMPKHQNT